MPSITATEAAESSAIDLRAYRETLRISQAELARLSKVTRYKINQHEQGSYELTAPEAASIRTALQGELSRLRLVPAPPAFGAGVDRALSGGGMAA